MANVQLAVAGDDTTQVILSVPGVQGPTGSSIPPSGTTNQILYKQSNTNYDTGWSFVTSAMIASGTIINDDVNASAAIAGTKISPNFGSQNVVTTGTSTAASFIPTSSGVPTNGLYLPAANNVAISTNGAQALYINADGDILVADGNRVGIGTTSPGGLLDITEDSNNGNATDNVNVYIESVNRNANLYLTSNASNSSALYFGDQADSDSARIVYANNNNSLAFGTNGAAQSVTIDSSGRLLVGTSSARTFPSSISGLFQIESTNATSSALGLTNNQNTGSGPYLIFSKSRGTAVESSTVVQNNDQLGAIWFAGTDGSASVVGAEIRAYVDGTPGPNDMPGRLVFSTTADGLSSPTERMRIDSTGLMTLAGPGIKFPATQVASADVNTLDDYEEGSWTPTIIGSITSGTASYSVQVGTYTKVGRVVHYELYVNWSGGTGSGFLRISGLPFTVAGSPATFSAGSIGYMEDVALSANHTPLALAASGNTYIYFYQVPSGGGTNISISYDAAGALIIAGTYRS